MEFIVGVVEGVLHLGKGGDVTHVEFIEVLCGLCFCSRVIVACVGLVLHAISNGVLWMGDAVFVVSTWVSIPFE